MLLLRRGELRRDDRDRRRSSREPLRDRDGDRRRRGDRDLDLQKKVK